MYSLIFVVLQIKWHWFRRQDNANNGTELNFVVTPFIVSFQSTSMTRISIVVVFCSNLTVAADPTDSDSDSSSDFAPADTATETDSSSTSTSTPVTSAPTPSETVTSITLSFPADGSDPSIPPVNPGSSQPTPPPVVVVGIHFIPAAGGASAPAPSSSGEAPSPVVQVKRGMQKKIRRV
ncbi:hypothetical protein FRC15_001681 [Serendipita sp. 397]|nr:hypothetical protein FRC15_001681 [Serendipita sp. 397]